MNSEPLYGDRAGGLEKLKFRKVSLPVTSAQPATTTRSTFAAISMVTVCPGAMVTMSPLFGTPLGDQVAGALQRPEPVEVFGAGAPVV